MHRTESSSSQPGARSAGSRIGSEFLLHLIHGAERSQSRLRFLRILLLLGGFHLPEPAPRLEIGEVVHDLFDGSADALEILLIEGAAFEIALDKLQTL